MFRVLSPELGGQRMSNAVNDFGFSTEIRSSETSAIPLGQTPLSDSVRAGGLSVPLPQPPAPGPNEVGPPDAGQPR